MVRIMWLLRRKPGISFEQFRDHYENSHAVLGTRYLGHLLTGYRRNYVVPADHPTAGGIMLRGVMAAKAWDYDCIAEWDLVDEAAFEQVVATLSDPVIGKIFHDDEEHFLDRASVRLIRCDRHETDTTSCTAPDIEIAASGSSLWDN